MAIDSKMEARKLNIIDQLAELQDEGILKQIENLLNPKVDFWDDLSDEEKSLILKGITDLEEGRKAPFSVFLAKHLNA